MYFQIVAARIHDMRGKIPNDDRRHGKIYLENTKMAATFQLKQTEESGIYAQETAQMRTIALNYVKNHMVAGLKCYFDHIDADVKKEYSWWIDFKLNIWDIDMVEELPQQDDRTSSGLFVLKYMEHWNGKRLEKGFTQNLIDQFRKKLAAILVNSPLNEENAITRSPLRFS
ncbi:hypothetical protein PAHAL_5G464900 [Panicum hallii]|uniref:Ubiquitin-like protease family profile domain-containing protein n=1 Tax=Panicum hallii TaxID=206008 RepID=A0A2T8INP5_9POAL|nr:hypothetical protein PAHAL_5G464900 [Panicum hallii]